jgi:TonB family protein
MRHKTGLGPWLVALSLVSGMHALAQFKEIGPAPVSASVARKQIKTLLSQAGPDNRQQTVTKLSGLLVWYRDLVDEELIAAWKAGPGATLADVVDALADPRLATAIVQFSWSERREATFIPAYESMLLHLMSRYPDSAQPFFRDLVADTPLTEPETETVCRILMDLPDIRGQRSLALRILLRHRAAAEAVLTSDENGSDQAKRQAAQSWKLDLNRAAAMTAPKPAGAYTGGAILTPLNPVTVDDTLASAKGTERGLIKFVNRCGSAVDVYWIDLNGDRVLSRPALPAGAAYAQQTRLRNPWLVVVSGTGGTTAQDTGKLVGGFEAVTPNASFDPAKEDVAIISGPGAAAMPGTRANPPTDAKEAGGGEANGTSQLGDQMGHGVLAPTVLTKVEPTYSKTAVKFHAVGTVLVSLIVLPDGTSRDFRVVKPMGYGLDEKAMEAVSKWQFRPGTKDGKPLAVKVTIEVNFRLKDDPEKHPNPWSSGAISFKAESGVNPPSVKDGAMPKPDGDVANENTVLEFTVDTSGAVKDVRSVYGSQAAAELMGGYLYRWKFSPATKGDTAVEATGRVLFTKGPTDDAARKAATIR